MENAHTCLTYEDFVGVETPEQFQELRQRVGTCEDCLDFISDQQIDSMTSEARRWMWLYKTIFGQKPNEISPEVAEKFKAALVEYLKSLTYREREVFALRNGLKDNYFYTLEETGRIFKITRERVRQIEAKVIRKLQHPAGRRVIAEAMGLREPGNNAETLVAEMVFSVRARHAMNFLGVKTLGQLASFTEQDVFSRCKNIGWVTIGELRQALRTGGLDFKPQ